jgi:4-hydroxy-tetrahydrodipicolinate reductase
LCFEERLANIVRDLDIYLKNKTIVHILGSNGKLGKLIVEEIKNSNNKTIGELFDHSINISNINKLKNQEVIVDVSSPLGTKTLLEKLIQNNIYLKLVIGTTGDLPIDLINKYNEKCKYAYICPNFSIGITRILQIIEQMKSETDYWNIKTITDVHHINKKDSPSGTAKLIKQSLENVGFNECEITSKREGSVVGYHDIVLDNLYETIEIIHNAKDRKLFAIGCLRFIDDIILN